MSILPLPELPFTRGRLPLPLTGFSCLKYCSGSVAPETGVRSRSHIISVTGLKGHMTVMYNETCSCSQVFHKGRSINN